MQEKNITLQNHHFAPSILREYDIRGIVGETLSVQDAYTIGRTFATYVLRHSGGNKKIITCRDGRLSSPDLEQALSEGLEASGAEVVRIGIGPTPMLYFTAYTQEAAAGIMVTGSHNPPNHNGFKFVMGKASFYGEQLKMLGNMAVAADIDSNTGTTSFHNSIDAYVEALVAGCVTKAGRELKIAWDAGNGAAGEIMERLCAKLPGTHILLNSKIDGTFPNHHPDPTVPENLVQLIETVQQQHCDFGIAFDGDGDRVGVVDGKGRIVWGDQLLLILAKDVLRQHPGATIIADVKASQSLFDGITQAGGNAVMWKTGHSLIKAKMAETKAVLAGEMSGHIFFADRYYGYDDGLYAAVRLVDFSLRAEQSITEMVDDFPPAFVTPEIRITCPDDRKFSVVEEVKARLETQNATLNTIDGIRVLSADGWWLLRASNTQAALVARCEAADAEALERLKNMLSAQLLESGIVL